ncbi:STAS domain-containing protein [Cytobacillus firmus]|uniref:STAS domain-containing protein n=1 Tax=Cytobacillus firmus TaxID=1399 RepID=UPI0036AC7A22
MQVSLSKIFETKRKKMIESVNINELTSEKALRLSEEMDVYINLMQRKFSSQDFRMDCIDKGKEVMMTLKGQLDYLSAEQIDIFLSSFSTRFKDAHCLRIDLAPLSFIDSAGANGLYKLIVGAAELGLKTELITDKGTVYEILEILGLFKFINQMNEIN